jgi:hypothetical protein
MDLGIKTGYHAVPGGFMTRSLLFLAVLSNIASAQLITRLDSDLPLPEGLEHNLVYDVRSTVEWLRFPLTSRLTWEQAHDQFPDFDVASRDQVEDMVIAAYLPSTTAVGDTPEALAFESLTDAFAGNFGAFYFGEPPEFFVLEAFRFRKDIDECSSDPCPRYSLEDTQASTGSFFMFRETTAPGNANLDGAFDSSDLVQVFGAGKYETGIRDATWADGDWNHDSLFGSRDLIIALQYGAYNENRPAVPEPTSLQILAGLAVLVMLRPRRLPLIR